MLDHLAVKIAAQNGRLDIVKYLVSVGADIYNEEDDGNAFWHAAEGKHVDVLDYLIEFDGHVERGLIAACQVGNTDMMKYYVDRGADIQYNENEALREMARNNKLEDVKYLHQRGADIHAMNEYALKIACVNGNLDIVKYLHQKGADIHNGEEHPLALACANNELDVIKYLIDQGTDSRMSRESIDMGSILVWIRDS